MFLQLSHSLLDVNLMGVGEPPRAHPAPLEVAQHAMLAKRGRVRQRRAFHFHCRTQMIRSERDPQLGEPCSLPLHSALAGVSKWSIETPQKSTPVGLHPSTRVASKFSCQLSLPAQQHQRCIHLLRQKCHVEEEYPHLGVSPQRPRCWENQ